MTHLSSIELSREALFHNVDAFRQQTRSLAEEAQWVWTPWITAVVKANAYGHGLDEIVSMLEGQVEFFQVDDLDELRRLRRVSQTNALVFGYVPIAQVEEAQELFCELSVYDVAQLEELARLDGGQFSIKIDALLGRQGVLPHEVDTFIKTAGALNLRPVAVYAHYANIEDTTDLTHADAQEALFSEVYEKFEAKWPGVGKHISATSGLLAHEDPRTWTSMVRLGIGLYGLYPSAPLARSHAHLDLRPVMRWVSHLAQVKTLPSGHPVGYGLTYRTARPTTIGIVPQGYSDGYDRGLSNVGEVLVHGRRCPVVGRVAMNMFAIDLTPAPNARAEDEVVLLGAQGEERITAEEIAAKLGTINYEVVARVSPLLPRVIV